MRKGRFWAATVAAIAIQSPGWAGGADAGATPGPEAALVAAEGLEATLFAAEPLLSSPSDIDVDSRGRVWVCEVTNYRGKKDTRPEGDRILVLEDTDGDGRADTQTVFHQGRDVDSALGVCVLGEGPGRKVIVSCGPDVFLFHDDDGDLKADRRESLFTKTGVPQHDHSVHAFVVGPDGRLYFNFGNYGKAVHDREGRPVKDRFGNEVNASGRPYREGMVFRCKPDGTDFEVLGHNFRNNYEVAVDSFGTLWQSDNDDDGHRGTRINYVMEYGNYGYKNEATGAGWQVPRTNIEAEIPRRHWHQNDPGVVPNLLLTGGGSPCGMCVYEGTLLPQRYRGAVMHCDAGPNVVRAYHSQPSGAGFTATIETLVDGSADKWFRPCDVCVAPDGSLIVADWHDPGVGGHGMADTAKGRIFRIAPRGSKWSVPTVDMATVTGAVEAMESPNLCTRAMALDRIGREPGAAVAALDAAARDPQDERHAARLAWALGMLPGRAEATVQQLAAANDPQMRSLAIRMCRRVQGDVLGLVETLARDPEAAVRRECALALRGLTGERADRAWAELAAAHVAGDRWELEALGIGADSPRDPLGPDVWNGRLAAWLAKTGEAWRGPAGREIVWRSRALKSAELIAALIVDPTTSTPEALCLARALDFQPPAASAAAMAAVVPGFTAPDEKLRAILPELVLRLDPGAAAVPAIARRIDEAASFAGGMPAFVRIVRRFRFTPRMPDLLAMAAAAATDESVAIDAVSAALDLGGAEAIGARLRGADAPATDRLRNALGGAGSTAAVGVLEAELRDASAADAARAAAVRALAKSKTGGTRLVALAKEGALAGPQAQAAGVALSACPWGDVREAAAAVLPLPKPRGGGTLPAVTDLVRMEGDAARGRALFAGAATCSKCHVVNGAGKAVGPDLSEIGSKLARPALYEAILAPSAAISHNYETWTAILADGRSVTGLLVSQSPAEAIVRGADGIDVAFASADIEELVKQPVSLMPADIAAALTAQELSDVVAWLETLRTAN